MGNYYNAIYEMVDRLVDNILFFDREGLKGGKKGDMLSLLDIRILQRISKSNGKKIYELIKDTGLRRRIINSSIQRLINCSYIIKEQSEKDRRVHILRTTDSGEEFVSRKLEEHNAWLEDVLEEMSQNERKIVLKFLKNINKK